MSNAEQPANTITVRDWIHRWIEEVASEALRPATFAVYRAFPHIKCYRYSVAQGLLVNPATTFEIPWPRPSEIPTATPWRT